MAVEPYHQRLRRLRRERGLSQPALFREARGVSLDTIRALERDPAATSSAAGRGRARYPSAATLASLAEALRVEPDEFPEYRLAVARDRLDERIVGLDRALATLERVKPALVD